MPNYTLYYFNGRGRAEILRMLFAAASVKYMDKRFEFNEWDKYRKDMPCMCVPVLEMDGGMRMPETMAIARYLAREYGFYPKTSMEMMRCDYIADCFYEIMHDYMRYFHWKNGRFRFNMSSSGSGMSGSGMAGSGMGGSGMAGSGMGGSGMAGSGMSGSGMAGSGMGGSGMAGSGMGGSGNGYNSPTNRGGDMNSNYDNYMQWRYMNTCQRVLPFLERTLDMQNGGKNFFMGDQMMWCDMMCYCSLENPYMENQSMFNKYGKLMALRNRVASHPKISGYLKNRSNTNW